MRALFPPKLLPVFKYGWGGGDGPHELFGTSLFTMVKELASSTE